MGVSEAQTSSLVQDDFGENIRGDTCRCGSDVFGKILWQFCVVERTRKRQKMSFYIPVPALLHWQPSDVSLCLSESIIANPCVRYQTISNSAATQHGLSRVEVWLKNNETWKKAARPHTECSPACFWVEGGSWYQSSTWMIPTLVVDAKKNAGRNTAHFRFPYDIWWRTKAGTPHVITPLTVVLRNMEEV